jgi:3-deoxy-D-manno-octulosonate 8-phosphate phosphatase KdsC-like HAD superfamily phosphatase
LKNQNNIRCLGCSIAVILGLMACNPNDSHKKIGNSQDTTSVNKGGEPAIRDTATINKDHRDSANRPASDSTSKGNVDPSGH